MPLPDGVSPWTTSFLRLFLMIFYHGTQVNLIGTSKNGRQLMLVFADAKLNLWIISTLLFAHTTLILPYLCTFATGSSSSFRHENNSWYTAISRNSSALSNIKEHEYRCLIRRHPRWTDQFWAPPAFRSLPASIWLPHISSRSFIHCTSKPHLTSGISKLRDEEVSKSYLFHCVVFSIKTSPITITFLDE